VTFLIFYSIFIYIVPWIARSYLVCCFVVVFNLKTWKALSSRIYSSSPLQQVAISNHTDRLKSNRWINISLKSDDFSGLICSIASQKCLFAFYFKTNRVIKFIRKNSWSLRHKSQFKPRIASPRYTFRSDRQVPSSPHTGPEQSSPQNVVKYWWDLGPKLWFIRYYVDESFVSLSREPQRAHILLEIVFQRAPMRERHEKYRPPKILIQKGETTHTKQKLTNVPHSLVFPHYFVPIYFVYTNPIFSQFFA